MTTQNWPQDPLVPSTTGNEGSTSDLSTTELGTSKSAAGKSGSGDSKKSAAKNEAKQVGQEGKDAAKDLAGTAASEAKSVAAEAGSQAKDLMGTLTSEVKNQAGTQQQKVTDGIRSISDELKAMAEKSDNEMVANLVRQASQRTDTAASWLENRDAGDILDDVKSFARRKPGTFLTIAAGTGVLIGRLTRGLKGNRDSEGSSDHSSPRRSNDTGSYPGYTEVDSSAYSGTPASAGFGGPTGGGQHVADSRAAVDPSDDYPTIPPGTPPVGTRSNNGGLR